jgi:predicted solute-binding protein
MKGLGLIVTACKITLRFAGRYYAQNRYRYSASQQVAIDALIESANNVLAAVAVIIAPVF